MSRTSRHCLSNVLLARSSLYLFSDTPTIFVSKETQINDNEWYLAPAGSSPSCLAAFDDRKGAVD